MNQRQVVATPTATDLSLRDTRLAELNQELARMDAQQRLARGDYYPERKPPVDKDAAPLAGANHGGRYIPYPKSMQQLTARLGATPEELAAWIWIGPKDGGIAAYMNANELDPPPRFFYATGSDSQDYIAPLMACWFKAEDIDQIVPADRYITGKALIDRWGQRRGLHPKAFIQAKIAESRLLDIHPIYGGTRGTFSEHADFPPISSGLFPLSQVEKIEAEDFAEVGPGKGPRKPAPPKKPQAISEPMQFLACATEIAKTRASTVRRDARKLDTQDMYKHGQKAYRVAAKERPNMSDTWYAQQIAKKDIARRRGVETIRKHMKP